MPRQLASRSNARGAHLRDMQTHIQATHSFAEVLRFEIRQDLDQVPDDQRPTIVRDIYRNLLGYARPAPASRWTIPTRWACTRSTKRSGDLDDVSAVAVGEPLRPSAACTALTERRTMWAAWPTTSKPIAPSC